MMEEARRGWDSDFGKFEAVHHSQILNSILRIYPGSSEEEKNSWRRNVSASERVQGTCRPARGYLSHQIC